MALVVSPCKIRKKRNKRIFDSEAMSAADVLREIKLKIGLRWQEPCAFLVVMLVLGLFEFQLFLFFYNITL